MERFNFEKIIQAQDRVLQHLSNHSRAGGIIALAREVHHKLQALEDYHSAKEGEMNAIARSKAMQQTHAVERIARLIMLLENHGIALSEIEFTLSAGHNIPLQQQISRLKAKNETVVIKTSTHTDFKESIRSFLEQDRQAEQPAINRYQSLLAFIDRAFNQNT